MKVGETIREIIEAKAFWILIFLTSLLLKTHVSVQGLLFFLMILGPKQFQNLLLYWLYRLSKVSEIPLPWGPLKLPDKSQVEMPPDLMAYDENDEIISDKLFNKALQSFSAGHLKEAIVLAESAVEKYPDNFKANVFLGFAYDLNPINEPSKAVKYNQKALEVKPASFLPQFNLAVATNHVDGPIKSLAEYLKAEEYARKEGVDPDSEIMGKLNLFLADDYKNTGQLGEAEPHYKRAEEILSRLVEKGDRTSQHWLTAARKRRDELAAMQKESK